MEFSTKSNAVAFEIAQRVRTQGGVALIADYGFDHASSDSLRGIKDHAFVDPLQEPGLVDLSVDVDFRALSHAAESADDVTAHGPVEQGAFLQSLGILHRLESVLKRTADPAQREALQQAVRRLVHPDEMGRVYKFLAIAPTVLPPPPGFEFDEIELDDGGEDDGDELDVDFE